MTETEWKYLLCLYEGPMLLSHDEMLSTHPVHILEIHGLCVTRLLRDGDWKAIITSTGRAVVGDLHAVRSN